MGLIERILEKVITDHAGQFLKLNPDQLKTSLLKGEVVLSGVEIKTEAFADMMKMLPFRLKYACVKTLKAKVPWNELSSKSVRVHASGVELVLAPQKIDETAAGDSWADVVKRQRLLAAEMLMEGLMEADAEEREKRASLDQSGGGNGGGEDDEDDDAASQSTARSSSTPLQKKTKMSLVQRIVARIIDNLGITVDGLSIRYESEEKQGSEFSLQLASLNLFTISSSGAADAAAAMGGNSEPVFVDRTVRGADAVLRRRLKIAGLALVWHRAQQPPREIIRPFGLGVTLVQHLSSSAAHLFTMDARTEGSIEVSLGAAEIADMTALVERISAHDDYVTRSAILKLRPNFSVGLDPAAWWRYAIKAHMVALRQHSARSNAGAIGTSSSEAEKPATTWPRVMTLIQQRWKYIALYKQKLILADSKYQSRARKLAKAKSSNTTTAMAVVTAATADAKPVADEDEELRLAGELLRELEIVLPFRTIMLFRSFAEAEFRSEKAKLKKLHRSKQIPARAISAMVHGAASVAQSVQSVGLKRKTFLKSLSHGFRRSSSLSATAGATTATAATATSAQPVQQAAPVEEGEEEWMLSFAEKQVLYETVALDPSTAWMLDQTSFGTTKTRIGLAPASFEIQLIIPTTRLHLLANSSDATTPAAESGEAQSFFDVYVGEVRCRFENHGQHDIVHNARANLPLWACDVSLATMEFLEGDVSGRIPGSFMPASAMTLAARTSSLAPVPLIHLQLHSTYLGMGQSTRLRVSGEIQSTQLVVSFPLIQRFATLIQPVALPAMTERVQALRQYGARRAALAASQTTLPRFDVKLDWALPVILLPISQYHTLELCLGKFRSRTSTTVEGEIDCEVLGTKLQMRRLAVDAEGKWGVQADAEEATAQKQAAQVLMANTNLEAKIQVHPTLRIEAQCVTGISLRLPSIEPHWNAIGKTLATALEIKRMMPDTSPSSSSLAAAAPSATAWTPSLSLSLKIPKVEVYMAMIPGPGWIKLKTEHVAVSLVTADSIAGGEHGTGLTIKLAKLLIRDDVQQAGEHFKDLLRIDGTLQASIGGLGSQQGAIAVSIDSNVIINWNPNTMTRLVAFVAKNLMQRIESSSLRGMTKPRVRRREPGAAPSFPKLTFSLPHHTVLIKLNQDALAKRFGICRIEHIQLALSASGKLSLQIHNLSLYGMQWLALTETRGVQLFGSDLPEEFSRADNLVELEMDLVRNVVDVQVKRMRFLWAHTLTKQFADYMTDGVALVFAPLLAAAKANAEAAASTAVADPPLPVKPNLQIKGLISTAYCVCPALRFGEQYIYSAKETDEIILVVDEAPIHIVVHENGQTPLRPGTICKASACGSDATRSKCADNDDTNYGLHKLGVEIKISVAHGSLYSHHKRATAAGGGGETTPRKLASGFAGTLLWRIMDFSPAQLALRKTFQPNTIRERARIDFCKRTYGGTIPPAEMPKGVSPQIFDMFVDVNADNTTFDFALQDVHLLALIVFENIADHRRRWPKVHAPKMPLFDSAHTSVDANFASELGYGPDELTNGNYGEITVIPYEMPEKLESVDWSQDMHDFSGDAYHMVDLELFLNIPTVKFALSLEPGTPAVALINAKSFQMSLTEFYNRSQSVELGLEQVEVLHGAQVLLSSHASSFLRNPPTLRGIAPTRLRPMTMLQPPLSAAELLPNWEYTRESKPISIMVQKFPGKDKRVELGLESVQLNLDFQALGEMVQSMDGLDDVLALLKLDLARLNMPGGIPNGPKKLPRALVLELFCNQLVIKRDAVEEVALQGSAHVLIAQSRFGETRGLIESRLGLVLKCIAPEADVLEYVEEEGDQQQQQQRGGDGGEPPQTDLRSWLESVYRKKNPPKLAEVDSILRAFAYNEAELIRTVSIKYDEVFHGMESSVAPMRRPTPPPAKSTAAGGGKKERHFIDPAAAAKSAAAASKKMDVALVDPFSLKIDLNASPARTDMQCMVDPIIARVTNGNLELLKTAFVSDGTLLAFADLFNNTSRGKQQQPAALTLGKKSRGRRRAGQQQQQQLHFAGMLRGVECTLLNDFGNSQSLPLVKASMFGLAFKLVKDDDGLVANLGIVSPTAEPSEDAQLRLDYFNPRLLAWEPLLEPWEFALTKHANNAVEFTSKTPLNVNFTYSFAESFANWIAWRSAKIRPTRTRNHVTDHYIINDSGLALVFGVKDREGTSRRLESGRRAPLGFTSANVEQHRHGDYYRDTRLGLFVQQTGGGSNRSSNLMGSRSSNAGGGGAVLVNFDFIQDDGTTFAKLQSIPIDSFGTMVYGLGKSKIMLHISLENGSKVVRVRSPLHIQNNLNRAVDVLLVSSTACWALGPLPPNGALFPIPVDRLHCKLSLRPVTPAATTLEQLDEGSNKSFLSLEEGMPRVELEAEASSVMTRQCDENGYTWGPSIKLMDVHALVDRPLAMLFERTKSYSVALPFGADAAEEDSASEEDLSFVQQRNAGFGTQFAALVGVKSIASMDGSGLRDNYIVGLHPAIRVENRLPCDLLCRSMHYSEGDNFDVPLGGGRVRSGEDIDFHHVKLGESKMQILHDAALVSDELWLTMSLPNGGYEWSAPFRPTSDSFNQFVMVPKATTAAGSGSAAPGGIRLLLETTLDERSGAWLVVVFVETWLVNDARHLVPGLQLREIGVGGEEYLHDFKDRAHSIYEKLAKPQTAVVAAAASPSAAAASSGGQISFSSPAKPTTATTTEEEEQEISLFTEGRNVVVRFVLEHEAPVPCHWSNSLMLDAVGSHFDVKCEMEANQRKYIGLLGVSVNVAPNVAFRRSRVVTFSPRLIFINSTQGASVLYLSSGLHPTFDGLGTRRVERVDSLFFFDPKAIPDTGGGAGGLGGGGDAWAHSNKRICPILRLAVERADGTRFGWSGPFQCINSGGEFTLKLVCHHEPENVLVVRIRFEERDACTVIFVEEESTTFPIYRIVSHTDVSFDFCQDKMQAAGVERMEGGRGASRPFGWTEPNAAERQLRLIFPNAAAVNKDVSLVVNIDELSAPTALHLPAFDKSVWTSVRIRGMTKTLVVADQAPATSSSGEGADAKRHALQPAMPSEEEEEDEPSIMAEADEILTLFRIDLAQVGLSIVDRAPQELLYISLLNSVVEFSRTRSRNLGVLKAQQEGDEEEIEHLPHIVEALELSIGKFQVDNQVNDAQYQVLLGQSKPARTSTSTTMTGPMAQIKLVRRRFPQREEWFDYIELASFEVAELDCKIEDTLLLLLGRMAWDCAMSLRSEEELVSGLGSEDGAYSRLTNWLSTTDPDAAAKRFTVKNWLKLRGARAAAQLQDSSSLEKQGKKIYFAVLHILPLCINLSFKFTASDPIKILTLAQFRTASSLRGDDGLNAKFDADQVSKSLPPALINIDAARIRLLALYATHVLGDRQALFKTIAKHYTRQAITQVYYILGSSDLIGNPLGIVTGMAKGVNELVFHPMQGISNASPVEFVQGVGKGSVSFVRHVLSGTLDSFSKLSGALSSGVAMLSLDERFVSHRWDTLREQRDQSMTGMLAMGASSFVNSLVDGAGGVIYRPFLANTPIDFVRELGKGLVGLAVKPVVGLLDFASRTTSGVSTSLLHFDSWLAVPTSRVRLPRAFRGFERRLDPYSAENALVTLLLKQLERADGIALEYLAHAFVDATLLLVAAGQRLWCLHCVNRVVSCVWHLPLDAVEDVEYTQEPDFPAVRIRFVNPSSFVRVVNSHQQSGQRAAAAAAPVTRRGGAFDAELIIGGQVGLETQAMLAFHVDSFAKARHVSARLRKGLLRRRPAPPPTAPPLSEQEDAQAQPSAQRRTLGLVIGPIPRQMRYLAGSSHVGGIAVVLKVLPDSRAAEAGLKEGDIILTCDGQALDYDNPKKNLIQASQTGQDIVLRIKRSQNLPSIQVVLKV